MSSFEENTSENEDILDSIKLKIDTDEEDNPKDQKVIKEPKNFSAKAIYTNIKNKHIKEPSFDASSDFFKDSSTSNSQVLSESIQLIKVTDNRLEVCEDAANYLRSLKDKIGVISIGGPARTGKSLLLNLLTKSKSFEVGSRVQACTQGIWITPIKTEEKIIILVDSEGAKSVEKNSTFDAKLFSLLILMSSVFIFNTKGVIDEQSINQLTLATHVSEMISFRLSEDETEQEVKSRIKSLAPKFIWILRDFHLSLEDSEGNSITSKQYMENILNMKNLKGRNAQKISEVRTKLLEIFEDRSCYTLPRPVDQESELEVLNTLPVTSLRPKFMKAYNNLEKVLLENCPTKKMNGGDVIGLQLLIMLEEIISNLNEGIMPNLQTAWSQVIVKQYELLLEEAKELYQEYRNINLNQMPYEESELIYKLQYAKDTALAVLRDVQQKDQTLEEYAKEEFEGFYQEDLKFSLESNTSASEAYNLALIDRIFRQIIINLDNGLYKDNFDLFEKNWVSGIEEYEKLSKGPGKLLAITEFSRKHQHTSFSKFFQNTGEMYEQEIKELRDKQKDYQNMLFLKNKVEKDLVVEDHVIYI
jgi:Guanylate-binding protein, N-terminal domain